MSIELKKLAATDGIEIYEMLQELPANENGFVNRIAGMSFNEYKEWLKNAEQVGIVPLKTFFSSKYADSPAHPLYHRILQTLIFCKNPLHCIVHAGRYPFHPFSAHIAQLL